jgi:hypothetical protein
MGNHTIEKFQLQVKFSAAIKRAANRPMNEQSAAFLKCTPFRIDGDSLSSV